MQTNRDTQLPMYEATEDRSNGKGGSVQPPRYDTVVVLDPNTVQQDPYAMGWHVEQVDQGTALVGETQPVAIPQGNDTSTGGSCKACCSACLAVTIIIFTMGYIFKKWQEKIHYQLFL